MKHIVYGFSGLSLGYGKKYLFQLVRDRRLTEIYHSHDFYELIWVLDGEGRKLLNEKELSFEKNTVVIMRPGDSHCFLSQSESVLLLSLSVERDTFEKFATAFSEELLSKIKDCETPICFIAPPLVALSLFREDSIGEYDFKFLLSCFLKAFADSADERAELPARLSWAISEMKSPGNLRLGISALEKLSFYSRSHLSRLIKTHFGMSLKQYINEQRLVRAYSDILFTQRSAEEIAEELGFMSYSHFHRIFKTRFGVTPAALRKKSGSRTV